MNINQNVWEVIRILMENSFWGRNSSYDSLIRDLDNEVREFKQGCKNSDIENSMEEAADVMMIMFCLLYKIRGINEEISIDKIMIEIINKLKRRYQHIYSQNKNLEADEEKEVWQNVKYTESIANYMLCNNFLCEYCGKIGGPNIKVEGDKFFCTSCNKQIFVSKKNVLFYNKKKNRKKYIQIIIDSILDYAKGNISAPELLRTDYLEVYNSFYEKILTSDYDLKKYFIEYVCEKYQLDQLDVIQYCNSVYDNYRAEIDIISRYCQEIYKGNHSYLLDLTNEEVTKVINHLKDTYMDIEKRIEKVIKYNARNWNNQLVHKYLLKYNKDEKNRIIECMTIIHYKDEEIRDLTVELSNMYNCIVGCKFCASGALPEETCCLDALDYVRQLNTCLKESGVNPDEFDNFYVSFAGIGEPSAVYKIIADGMIMIKDIYPKVKFNIATFGFDMACFDYWSELDLPIRTLQIPFYSAKLDKLRYIVKNLPSSYNFETIVDKAVKYKNSHPLCRVKINYIAMKDINDSDDDICSLCTYLMKYITQITIRISYLNYTKPGEKSNIMASGSERLDEIKRILEQKGFDCYIFGTTTNTELGCGQLAQNHISSMK